MTANRIANDQRLSDAIDRSDVKATKAPHSKPVPSRSVIVTVVLTRAIVRPPSKNFADGLTSVNLGRADFAIALAQHEAYCNALEMCGLELIQLPADDIYPDSTFVEDTAVLTDKTAILTQPGAPSRSGEVASIGEVLVRFYPELNRIGDTENMVAPPELATLDGGDVCEAGDHFFIGISARTNRAGAEQLAAFLRSCDYTASFVDIRSTPNILHLKSGISYLGDNRLVLIDELADRDEFGQYEHVAITAGEEYAANCVRVNEHVLLAAGYPNLEETLRRLGYSPMVLELSEFRKMDGGLSCLSLRF